MSLINGRLDGQLCIMLVGMVICLLWRNYWQQVVTKKQGIK